MRLDGRIAARDLRDPMAVARVLSRLVRQRRFLRLRRDGRPVEEDVVWLFATAHHALHYRDEHGRPARSPGALFFDRLQRGTLRHQTRARAERYLSEASETWALHAMATVRAARAPPPRPAPHRLSDDAVRVRRLRDLLKARGLPSTWEAVREYTPEGWTRERWSVALVELNSRRSIARLGECSLPSATYRAETSRLRLDTGAVPRGP